MTFGLFLSLANHIHFKDQISVWCEFVPQFIFIMCTFGYMVCKHVKQFFSCYLSFFFFFLFKKTNV
eukprot:TRINITY_DN3505_c0_g1_i2.p2 TRINITY_DN3505_c0_g1~~TRINITY_DN3505_c0_g1_i2.p2  ORF type:complete len:66 (-),score=2.58 TRINITY_DN3505_c0_g1_i2:424-621(-)